MHICYLAAAAIIYILSNMCLYESPFPKYADDAPPNTSTWMCTGLDSAFGSSLTTTICLLEYASYANAARSAIKTCAIPSDCYNIPSYTSSTTITPLGLNITPMGSITITPAVSINVTPLGYSVISSFPFITGLRSAILVIPSYQHAINCADAMQYVCVKLNTTSPNCVSPSLICWVARFSRFKRRIPNPIYICLISPTLTSNLVARVRLRCLRSHFRSHDYRVHLYCVSRTAYGYSPFEIVCAAARFTTSRLAYQSASIHISDIQLDVVSDVLKGDHVDIVGGAVQYFSFQELHPFVDACCTVREVESTANFRFDSVITKHSFVAQSDLLLCEIPLSHSLLRKIPLHPLRVLQSNHCIGLASNTVKNVILHALHTHKCTASCILTSVVFKTVTKTSPTESRRKHTCKQLGVTEPDNRSSSVSTAGYTPVPEPRTFPPEPPSRELLHRIASGYCDATSPNSFIESGCASCGFLTPSIKLTPLNQVRFDRKLLHQKGVTRMERTSEFTDVLEIPGAILASGCDNLCVTCKTHLEMKVTPPLALANGRWIGDVPTELQDLSFMEKLLIARIRHSICVVKVASSWRYKMRANVICFSNPMLKIYQILPPPRDELDEMIAFQWTGPCRPTSDDLKRTPLLVRRSKVKHALDWLKLNHCDYSDLIISDANLDSYGDDGVPVGYHFEESDPEQNDPMTSAPHETSDDLEGTDSGPCPFMVHGLTGDAFSKLNNEQIKAVALEHLKRGQKNILFIGHDEAPVNTFNNPYLFPQLFPHLFPYGLGGVKNPLFKGKISSLAYKGHLLMYYDKRFQLDPTFALIGMNIEQMRESNDGGYVLSKRTNIESIAARLRNLDDKVLAAISEQLLAGKRIKPTTQAEKDCFALIHDIDAVAGKVPGSITSKKYMRNEVWSMISRIGSPSWFITLSPADEKHPLCIYFADSGTSYNPELLASDRRKIIVSRNPTAAARFFHFVVEAFIKHVLGVGADHAGLYGETAGYYGSVEQQGRLTLHLHVMLWIRSGMSPQDIRDRIMDTTSDFLKSLVEYLEGSHVGEFGNRSADEVSKAAIQRQVVQGSGYKDPTLTMAVAPPPVECQCEQQGCDKCEVQLTWWKEYSEEADDVACRSNKHKNCVKTIFGKDGRIIRPGCLDSRGNCKARFPREVLLETKVDPKTGYIQLRKGEAYYNTWTPMLTWLMRSNTDVTSLLSGTSVKAVVAYVTDYITKPGLKTHAVFDAVRMIYAASKKNETIDTNDNRKYARTLVVRIVNAMTAKMEMGSPMASMYLLGNPDHYTNFEFVPMYWKSYVNRVRAHWRDATDETCDIAHLKPVEQLPDETMVVNRRNHEYFGVSRVDDYVYRPDILGELSLYRWVLRYSKHRRSAAQSRKFKQQDISAQSRETPELTDGEDPMDMFALHPDRTSSIELSGRIVRDEVMQYAADINLDSMQISNDEPCIDDGCGTDTEVEPTGSDDMLCGGARRGVDDNEYESEDPMDLFHERGVALDTRGHSDNSQLDIEADHLNLSFQNKHPQYSTHCVNLPRESDTTAINFLGGNLPRRDQGDREYYCSVMLTLFKPWRKPEELKNVNESWDEAFQSYIFRDEDIQTMKNFNLRYECNDERDDFAAQRKKMGDNQEISASWADNDDTDFIRDMIDDFASDDYDDMLEPAHYREEEDEFVLPDSTHVWDINMMNEIERIVRAAGMFDANSGKYTLSDDIFNFSTDEVRSSNEWKSVVAAARADAINEMRKESVAENIDDDTSTLRADGTYTRWNEVVVEDISYVDKNFRAKEIHEQAMIDAISGEFNLNSEQDRAYRIVANHLTVCDVKPLSMYLGGMGGTGKSRILGAWRRLFQMRKEGRKICLTGPTGACSALLNASTYHSILVLVQMLSESACISKARENLLGVTYFIIDEVSMLSLGDLFRISERLAKVRNRTDVPFGGLNMIFVGDFAQLCPVGGRSFFNRHVGLNIYANMKASEQKEAIAKALWHQVTNVVLLRQNMRQKEQSIEDSLLRTSLENMRYGACTPDDIAYLRTRIAGRRANQPNLASKELRYVSVITGTNAQRDKLNLLGYERFAQEMEQDIHFFHSYDEWGTSDDPSDPHRRRIKRTTKGKQGAISDKMKSVLWSIIPKHTENLPGILPLCKGMPVMLKHNNATEINVTNGQEANVVAWTRTLDSNNREYLDTLFVKLINPSKTIQIDGLPENVVPLPKETVSIKCKCPNGKTLSISRTQVRVVLNFAMTDYNSQGRNRDPNVVDLSRAKNHHNYYTSLSRSTSSQATVIVQAFDETKITDGISGSLRQEFRELELLNEITRLRFEGELPSTVSGVTRLDLIQSYKKWKGEQHVPEEVPNALKWSNHDPLLVTEQTDHIKWTLVDAEKRQNKINKNVHKPKAKGTQNILVSAIGSNSLKRKFDECDLNIEPVKRVRQRHLTIGENQRGPAGLVWDINDWSCPYDAIMTILCDIWLHNPEVWSVNFQNISTNLMQLSSGFAEVTAGRATLEFVRDGLRRMLFDKNPEQFHYGPRPTSLTQMLDEILPEKAVAATTIHHCSTCGNIRRPGGISTSFMCSDSTEHITSNDKIKQYQKELRKRCPKCRESTACTSFFAVAPKIVTCITTVHTYKVSKTIKIMCSENSYATMKLRGIIYFPNYNHFTCRVITPNSEVWYNDGAENGGVSTPQGKLADYTPDSLKTIDIGGSKYYTAALIYARQ